jgi:hypothetical protein
MKPDQDAIHFFLIYGTRNAKGVEVFKQVEKRTEETTQLVRALRQQSQRQTLDLFSPDVLYKREERYRRFAVKQHRLAFEAVERLLAKQKRVPYDACWAEALQFPTVYEPDLRQWIKEQENSGNLRMEGRKEPTDLPKRGHSNFILKA